MRTMNITAYKDYKNITIAGYHYLHCQIWDTIVKRLEMGEKILSKPTACFQVGIKKLPTFSCFACSVSRNNILFSGSANCTKCPIDIFRDDKLGRPHCCSPKYLKLNHEVIADNFHSVQDIHEAIQKYGLDAVIETAKLIRDAKWTVSNKVLDWQKRI